MASLFKKSGNVLKPNLSNKISTSSPLWNIALYIMLGLILIVIVIMLLGIKIDFSIFDMRSQYSKVMSRSHLFWPPSAQFTNLSTPSDSTITVLNNSYSAMIDCVLYNTRSYKSIWSDETMPYRHIFHRGSNELISTNVGSLLVGGCASSGNSDQLPPNGLPSIMNPGVFLDPRLNDILVYVDTENTGRESVRINDLPLDIPFRIAVIISGLVLEVYINCKLEVTKILKSAPKDVGNRWYGLAGSASAQAQTMNLRLWSYPLTANDIRPLCPKIPDFKIKRPICDGADTPVPAPSAGTQNIDLGVGQALRKCNL